MDAVWFDDVVVATDYIGPIALEAPQPLLRARKLDRSVRLLWTDTASPSYSLRRSERPDLSDSTLLFEGAGLQADDPDALASSGACFYAVE